MTAPLTAHRATCTGRAGVPLLARGSARLAAGLGLAGLSALLGTWAFPPYGAWPLIFVAWVPMLVAQHQVLPRRWGWLAPGIGIGGYYGGYLSGVLGPGFAWWVAAIPAGVAVVAGAASVADRPLQEAAGYARFAVTVPLIWAAAEFLRGLAPGVGTQGYVAYALFGQPWLLQPVSVLGVTALNLLILVVNWTAGLGVLAALARHRARTPPLIPARAAAVSGACCAVAAGVWTGASVLMLRADAPVVTVAAIQPRLHYPAAAALRRDIAQTRRAAAAGARLVVWQEKTLGVDLPRNRAGTELAGLARQAGIYLVVGYGFTDARGQHNDATVISPAGRYLGVYGKQHPALMFADDQGSADTGTMPVYPTPFGRLATMICYDADYPGTAQSAARRGAQILAVPSWDPPGDAPDHYGLLVFRAIENRLTIIKADSAYDSAIIDPYGRILASAVTPRGARATLLARVPAGTGHTPQVRFGNLGGWITVSAALAAIAVGPWRSQRSPACGR